MNDGAALRRRPRWRASARAGDDTPQEHSQPTRPAVAWLMVSVAALGGVTLAWLAYSSWAACSCDKLPPSTEITRLVAGLSFVAAGMTALAQQRFRRVGVLLTAVGWAWFAYEIGYVYEPLPYTFARVAGGLWQPLLAHLALGFPSGRLRTRLERAVVAASYVLYLGSSVALLMFWHSRGPSLTANNLLFVVDNPRIEGGLELFTQALVIAMAAIVLGIVFLHWRTASVPERRALTPLLWASGPIVVVVGAYAVFGARFFPSLLPLAMTALPIAFAIGLLRIRLDRADIGTLVVELGRHPPRDRLQEALARTLHDPTLRVAYWARESQSFVDAGGHPYALPPEPSNRAMTRIERDGDVIAVLVHDTALRDDPELIDASVAAARLALENERLYAEVRAQLQEVRASRARIVNVRDAERQRLERDLHDGAQQRLVTLSLALKLLEARLHADTDPQVASTLREAIGDLNLALVELRELARGIHPAILSEAGLGPAVRSLAERMPFPVAITTEVDARLPSSVEVGAYYVVAEALTNVAKHAQASSATVDLMLAAERLCVTVADDGAGGADVNRGSGLQGLFDRVRALDGELQVTSPPGAGTRIAAVIPCPGATSREPAASSDL